MVWVHARSFLQVHEKEKATSDLCAVPEDEPLDSDTESKSLMERIKSIKQEKYAALPHAALPHAAAAPSPPR